MYNGLPDINSCIWAENTKKEKEKPDADYPSGCKTFVKIKM